MLDSEGIPENTETPGFPDTPEVFFFVVRAFSFQRGSGVAEFVQLFSHADFKVSFEKGVL